MYSGVPDGLSHISCLCIAVAWETGLSRLLSIGDSHTNGSPFLVGWGRVGHLSLGDTWRVTDGWSLCLSDAWRQRQLPNSSAGFLMCHSSLVTRGGVGLGWVKASPGRLPTVRAAFPAGPDWAAVPGCPVTRPTGLLTAPRPRGGARGREMPPCLCVCALVCLRGGGGGLWHTCLLHCCSALARGSVCLVLQAPAGRLESLTLSPPGEMWAWARNLHVTRTCYPTTPRLPIGTGRRWYVARLGSDPHSLTALGTGGAASRAGSGSHGRGRTLGRWRGTRAQSVLPCPGCHQCWLHWLRRYSPRRRGGPEGTTPEWPLR